MLGIESVQRSPQGKGASKLRKSGQAQYHPSLECPQWMDLRPNPLKPTALTSVSRGFTAQGHCGQIRLGSIAALGLRLLSLLVTCLRFLWIYGGTKGGTQDIVLVQGLV